VRLAKVVLRSINCACRFANFYPLFRIGFSDLCVVWSCLLLWHLLSPFSTQRDTSLQEIISHRGLSRHQHGLRSLSLLSPVFRSPYRYSSCTAIGRAATTELKRSHCMRLYLLEPSLYSLSPCGLPESGSCKLAELVTMIRIFGDGLVRTTLGGSFSRTPSIILSFAASRYVFSFSIC
jgi:hypothetical protein